MLKRLYLIAGEASGDILGAKLMAALRAKRPELMFHGVGGERMTGEGLTSLFPMQDLSVIGFAEVVPHLPRILRHKREAVEDILAKRPDAVVTIDSPGFNFQVAKALKGAGIPLIHYVAPSVWAYKPERAAKTADLYDLLLALLPFEPPYFEMEGLRCVFVGHPVVEDAQPRSYENFRVSHEIAAETKVLCVSPGSRRGELTRHLPVFRATVARLKNIFPALQVIMPVVPAVAPAVRKETAHWPVPVHMVENPAEKQAAFAACDAALTKSGTVTMELALAKVPMVVAYRANPVSAWLIRRMIRVKYVNLINLLLNKQAIPEYLQERCEPELLTAALVPLLQGLAPAAAQREAFHAGLSQLGLGKVPGPSERAANVILEFIEKSR